MIGRLFRGLEQRAGQNVKPDVAEGRRDHLGAAVVAVLAELSHHESSACGRTRLVRDPRPAVSPEHRQLGLALVGRAIDLAHHLRALRRGRRTPRASRPRSPRPLPGRGRPRPRRLEQDCQFAGRERVSVTGWPERVATACASRRRLASSSRRDLGRAHRRCCRSPGCPARLFVVQIGTCSRRRSPPRRLIDRRLPAGGRLLDQPFRQAIGIDRLGHAAQRLRPPRSAPRPFPPARWSGSRRSRSPPADRRPSVTPVSCCRISCVLRAMRAEKLGRQRHRLVERSWCAATGCRRAPPTAPRKAVRMTLLYGSCSCSDTPDVWQWVRSISDDGLLRLELRPRSATTAAAQRAAWRPP